MVLEQGLNTIFVYSLKPPRFVNRGGFVDIAPSALPELAWISGDDEACGELRRVRLDRQGSVPAGPAGFTWTMQCLTLVNLRSTAS